MLPEGKVLEVATTLQLALPTLVAPNEDQVSDFLLNPLTLARDILLLLVAAPLLGCREERLRCPRRALTAGHRVCCPSSASRGTSPASAYARLSDCAGKFSSWPRFVRVPT